MIKSLTLSTLIIGMYQNPTYALLIAIFLVFIADIINQMITRVCNKEEALKSHYSQIKDIFNNLGSEDYIKPEEASTKLEVVPVNISLFSYRELQAIAKSLNISGRNRKRVVLEQELLNFCN